MKEVIQRVAHETRASNKKPGVNKLAKFKGLILQARQLFRYEEPKGTGDFVGGEFEKD